MKIRYRYVPFNSVSSGMKLGEDVKVFHRGYFCLSLPEGHVLTVDNLRQLAAHQAEYILISEEDVRTPEQIESDASTALARVKIIFTGADFSHLATVALFNQILVFREASWPQN